VWNKSHREHLIVGTSPGDVRKEADDAVSNSSWSGAYYVDADHIGLSNVDGFMGPSDFFTLDVADFIGEKAGEDELEAFVKKYSEYCGQLSIDGIPTPLEITIHKVRNIAEKYLVAVNQAAEIYRYIESKKGKDKQQFFRCLRFIGFIHGNFSDKIIFAFL
jgi:hypothetical protein